MAGIVADYQRLCRRGRGSSTACARRDASRLGAPRASPFVTTFIHGCCRRRREMDPATRTRRAGQTSPLRKTSKRPRPCSVTPPGPPSCAYPRENCPDARRSSGGANPTSRSQVMPAGLMRPSSRTGGPPHTRALDQTATPLPAHSPHARPGAPRISHLIVTVLAHRSAQASSQCTCVRHVRRCSIDRFVDCVEQHEEFAHLMLQRLQAPIEQVAAGPTGIWVIV
jgi:hypothetical protein